MDNSNQEPLDIDKITFKPINEGLGFHQHNELKKKKIITPIKTSQTKLGRKLDRPKIKRALSTQNNMNQIGLENKNLLVERPVENKFTSGYLGGKKQEATSVDKIITFENAPTYSKIASSLIDTSLVIACFMALLFSFSRFISFNFYTDYMKLDILEYSLLGILFAIIYIVYFSLFSFHGTVGNTLLKIRTITQDIDKKKINGQNYFLNVCIRSLLNLVLLPIHLLPEVENFLDKLTKVRMVDMK